MAKNEVKETEELSKSKQKRAERQKEIKKAKTQKTISKAISLIIALVVIGAFVVAIGLSVYKNVTRTQSSVEYSKGLTEYGKVKGVNPLDYISLPDYNNLTVANSEVSATEEEIENDIASLLDSHKEIKDDSSLEVVDGDTVNIDYVGSIDGVEFEGGNSNGEGYDLTIGSGQFIDGFEEQLIGHNPGELVVVKATFPEDYSNEELAGKAAQFDVTINGIYVAPAFTDEFVKENYSEYASTTAEYREYLANNYFDERLTSYITNYVVENTTLNKEPKSYIKVIKSLLKGNDEMTLSYYNQMFSQYGMTGYENLWDLVEGAENEADYEKDLKSRAAESCKEALAYQAIFENENLSLDMDAYFAELSEENGEEYVESMKESYGVEYMAQTRMRDLVVEYLKGVAKVQ